MGLDSVRWFHFVFCCFAGYCTFGLHALKLDWISLCPSVHHGVKAVATGLEHGLLGGLFGDILGLVESLLFSCHLATKSLDLLLKICDFHPVHPLLLHSG